MSLTWHNQEVCRELRIVLRIDQNNQDNEIKVHIYAPTQSGQGTLSRKLFDFIIMWVQPNYFLVTLKVELLQRMPSEAKSCFGS